MRPIPPSTSVTCSSIWSDYRNPELRSAGKVDYVVAANWKGIVENYNECLHCPGVHPELNALSNYMSGDEIEGDGAWCGGSMTLTAEGATTMGSGGGHATDRPPIDGLSQEDLSSVLYVALFPNALVSFHPDYVMLHTLYPRAPDRTDVVCEFFFEADTVEAAGLRSLRRDRVLGQDQPPGLVRLRARPEGRRL